MLTHTLEKLVLCEKASVNTYVVGGAEKTILNVDSDRFIIITGLTYFNRIETGLNSFYVEGEEDLAKIMERSITQLRIFSAKSNNLFTFRDNIGINTIGPSKFAVAPQGSVNIDTYLIHDSSVSFTFSTGNSRKPAPQIANSSVPAYPPPFDYGKLGQVEAIPVTYTTEDAYYPGFISLPIGLADLPPASNTALTTEFTYPVDENHQPSVRLPYALPLLHVTYVEILGNPTNIAATL
jgi:hypothetical protein